VVDRGGWVGEHAGITEAFRVELAGRLRARLAQCVAGGAAGEPGEGIGIPELLAGALKKELEAAEEAAVWMASERDVDVKLALARQCGDEARHYRLI
jgi:hypothetical protein